ncbi:MAG: class I tRNA ligase family protein, partial [Pseudomonadota bacterium]
AEITVPDPADLDAPSRWIRSQLDRTITTVDQALVDYRFDLAAKALYEFVWNEFCDWYLELSKPALFEEAEADNPALANATRHTLATVLETTLRLLHPFIPFVTEEIWQRVRVPAGVDGEHLMLCRWPETGKPDTAAEADTDWLKSVISAIRSARTELNLAPGKPMPLLIQHGSEADRERLNRFEDLIKRLARLERIETVADDRDSSDCAVALAGDMRLLIPLAGLVDVGEELARLEKQLDRESKGLMGTEKKLANERFVANAPAEVVERERERLVEHQTKVDELRSQIDKLKALS